MFSFLHNFAIFSILLIEPNSLFTHIILTKKVSSDISSKSFSMLTNPFESTSIYETLKPFVSRYFAVSKIEGCSIEDTIKCFLSVTSAIPFKIILLLSVDPEVKITSFGLQPKTFATFFLASSRADLALSAN